MPVVNPGVICIPARGPYSTDNENLYERTTTLDSNDIVTLNVAAPFTKVGLVRFKVKRVAGTAANFLPYLFSKVGVVTPGDISQEYVGTSTAVANLFDPVLGATIYWMQTDENGCLYMMLTPDAGSDNTFDYTLRFLKGE